MLLVWLWDSGPENKNLGFSQRAEKQIADLKAYGPAYWQPTVPTNHRGIWKTLAVELSSLKKSSLPPGKCCLLEGAESSARVGTSCSFCSIGINGRDRNDAETPVTQREKWGQRRMWEFHTVWLAWNNLPPPPTLFLWNVTAFLGTVSESVHLGDAQPIFL